MFHVKQPLAAGDERSKSQSDNAQRQLGVIGENEEADKGNCAAKAIATATARAALLGIELQPLPAGYCRLRAATGRYLGTFPDLAALTATLTRLERERGAP